MIHVFSDNEKDDKLIGVIKQLSDTTSIDNNDINYYKSDDYFSLVYWSKEDLKNHVEIAEQDDFIEKNERYLTERMIASGFEYLGFYPCDDEE